MTDDELREKLTAIAGGYKVGLATTGGLAASLLVNAERGFPTGYLDDYPALIEALTADQVNAAIARYLDPDAAARHRGRHAAELRPRAIHRCSPRKPGVGTTTAGSCGI